MNRKDGENMKYKISEYRQDIIHLCEEMNPEKIEKVCKAFLKAYYQKKQIFVAGNGGSAGTANHFVCDFGKNAVKSDSHRPHVLSLSANMEVITALGNDFSYDEIFSQQLKNLMHDGDLLLLISASGNSPNVVKAAEYAKSRGGTVIGFAGFSGGKLQEISDICITVPSESYEKIEDIHMMLTHILVCYFKELKLFQEIPWQPSTCLDQFDKDDRAFSRRVAAESFVLLKNNGTLPLEKDKPVALFGRTQFDTWKSGYGAADLWTAPVVPFAEGMQKEGNVYLPLYHEYYNFCVSRFHKYINTEMYKRTNFFEEMEISDETIIEAAEVCETAVLFIGRCAGEATDWHDIAGEYRLTEAEESLIRRVCDKFCKTVLVFNIPAQMDISFLRNYSFDAILHTFLPGMEAGNALADVIYGNITPGGKLPDSWAETYDCYPTARGEVTNEVVYSEGVYMGYRYFDSFDKEVVFPFGFGLSYTKFRHETLSVEVDGITVTANIRVTNCGNFSGREVVQCYLSPPDGCVEKPYQTLCGFEKTVLLAPEESDVVSIKIDLSDFSSYCTESAVYFLEAGYYLLREGKHSRDTKVICMLRLSEEFICLKVLNRLTPQQEFERLRKSKRINVEEYNVPVYELDATGYKPKNNSNTLAPEAINLAAQLTDEELILLLSGNSEDKCEAYGIEIEASLIDGEGTHTHKIKRLNIPATTMQDGPSGIRLSAFQTGEIKEELINGKDCVAYPSATSVAATWDRSLAETLARHIAHDMDRYGLPGWCAPGVNLHRTPLNGRNFEYFSEDPFLSAQMAIQEIKGIQQLSDESPSGRYAILKHLAFNEMETLRLESNSIVDEQTARELYLRSFEYVIRSQPPMSIMTSYNKINDIYTAACYDLCTAICREEWGFEGLLMSDWFILANAEDCVNAGNDILMPGRYIPIDYLQNNRINRAKAQKSAARLINLLMKTKSFS